MQKVINFEIAIPDTAVSHMKDKSRYDHNYYYIDTYGDRLYGELNMALQVYNECSNCDSYEYGYFEEDEFDVILRRK